MPSRLFAKAESDFGQSDRTVTRWVPGMVIAAVAAWLLLSTGVAATELLRFTGYWVAGVIIPGGIVQRLLRGQPASLVAELGLAATTGIALEVLSALAANVAGVDSFARWWVLVVYGMLFIPSVRRAVRHRAWRRRESPLQAWAIAALGIVDLLAMLRWFRSAMLPPQASTVNIDRWWHLGLVQEMLKPGMPVDPQVAGEPMVYHWFSHMHLAVASQVSGVDPVTVVLRLWLVPVTLVLLALVVTLARTATGVSWAGPLAGWLTFSALAGGMLWTSPLAQGAGSVVSRSPSQLLSIVTLTAMTIGVLEIARRPVGRRRVAWVVIVSLAALGMKPSVIPVILCGTLLAVAALTVIDRRVNRRLVGLSAMLTIAFAGSVLVTNASGNLTLLGSLHSMWPYSAVVASGPRGMSTGLLVDTLVGWRAWLVAVTTLAYSFAASGLRFMGLVVLLHPRTRRDPAGWILGGGFIAGWSAALLIDHVGRSQFYFLGAVAALGSVLAAWMVVLVVRGAGEREDDATPSWTVAALVLAGANVAWLARAAPDLMPGDFGSGPLEQVWVPMVVAGLIVGGMVVGARRWGPRSHTSRRAAMVVVLVALGALLPGSVLREARAVARVWVDPSPVNQDSIDYLTRQEQEAALWLRANSRPLDVVVTNAHCRPKQQSAPGCDARGYWLAGLSGRRVLLGGWAYTDEAQARHGVDGRSMVHQPPPWDDRYELSQAAFADPTEEVMAELRQRGVDWLVGDRRAGDVSVDVGEFADLRYENDLVSIWRLES